MLITDGKKIAEVYVKDRSGNDVSLAVVEHTDLVSADGVYFIAAPDSVSAIIDRITDPVLKAFLPDVWENSQGEVVFEQDLPPVWSDTPNSYCQHLFELAINDFIARKNTEEGQKNDPIALVPGSVGVSNFGEWTAKIKSCTGYEFDLTAQKGEIVGFV